MSSLALGKSLPLKKNKKPTRGSAARPQPRRQMAATPSPLPAIYGPLEQIGYQVIPDVLRRDECDSAVASINAWFTHATDGVLRFGPDDGAAWRVSANRPPSLHGGLLQRYRVPYIDGVLRTRLHPGVIGHFEAIWGTSELVVSQDGICVIPPWEWTGARAPHDPKPDSDRARVAHLSGTWYHFDQNPAERRRVSVQGQVALRDVGAGDATLAVLAGSHRYFENGAFAARFPETVRKPNDDWVKFTDEQICWLRAQPGVEEVAVEARAGSLILWDSRTAHCIMQPRPVRRAAPAWRYVVYACALPARNLSDKAYRQHAAWIADRRTTNHLGAKAFAADMYPCVRQDASLALSHDPLRLTAREARLMGLLRYGQHPAAGGNGDAPEKLLEFPASPGLIAYDRAAAELRREAVDSGRAVITVTGKAVRARVAGGGGAAAAADDGDTTESDSATESADEGTELPPVKKRNGRADAM